MQGTQVWSPVQEDPTSCTAAKPTRHDHRARTFEPASCNYHSLCVEGRRPTTRGATAGRSLGTATKPLLTAAREGLHAATTQHNQKYMFLKIKTVLRSWVCWGKICTQSNLLKCTIQWVVKHVTKHVTSTTIKIQNVSVIPKSCLRPHRSHLPWILQELLIRWLPLFQCLWPTECHRSIQFVASVSETLHLA